MSNELAEPATTPKLIWADTPWIVAALLGIWGAMVGIEEFRLANIFLALTALVFVVRLFRDSIGARPRKFASLVVGVIVVIAITAAVFHFTKKKQIASEAKAQEIPGLNDQITQLQGTIATQKKELEARGIREGQQLIDIKGQNIKLQQSVDTKDKALVDIAKHQYSLNFLPEIVVMWDNNSHDVRFINNGQTSVTLAGLTFKDFAGSKINNPPIIITKGASYGYSLTDAWTSEILKQAQSTGNSEITHQSTAYIQTLDQKKYEVSFTIHCDVNAGAITKTLVDDNTITPSDWSGLQ